jgi:hypothetical protein
MRESGLPHCALRSVSLSCSISAAALNFWCSSRRRTSASRGSPLVRRIAGRGLGPRQQHLALDVDQRRRHHQELAGDVEVQLLHQVQVLEVLPGDDRDLDVVDVHLVLLDQMNEQIERALEGLQLDLDRLELRLEELRSARSESWSRPAVSGVSAISTSASRPAHAIHGLARHALRLLRAFHQHVANVAGLRQRLRAALADRIEQVLIAAASLVLTSTSPTLPRGNAPSGLDFRVVGLNAS